MARGGGFQCKLQALLLEWVGPYDDEKLGFHKVAKYMHVPGVLELEANTDLYINKAKWAEQPVAHQAILRAACAYALMEMLAGFDARNPKALTRLVAAGAQLVVLSPDILKALHIALEQVLDEEMLDRRYSELSDVA